MTIEISIEAEDLNHNKIYFIFENGHWGAINKACMSLGFSNFSSNSAELYIALDSCKTKIDAIRAIEKYAGYILKNSAK